MRSSEVIAVYMEILLEAFNSSYRQICLLDTMGNHLERMILKLLQSHMVGEISRLKNQFGFWRDKCTVGAIQAVVYIDTEAKTGTGKRKGFCALINIGIQNAFNTARWKHCIKTIMRKKVPEYLLRMMDDYVSNSWVICEGDK